jgi:pyruvate formate lyase activating enzyme
MIGKEAELYEKLPAERVRCTACARLCNIPKGKIGLCGIRGNVNGNLRLFSYGRVIASHIDPIEKKPVTHYLPGSRVYSIATSGCNWLCKYCQNYDISQRRQVVGDYLTPDKIVSLAMKAACKGIAYTYNEPSIFMEFARDVGVVARQNQLFNIFVSNGYDTADSVSMMNQFLDCITVDFKGSGETGFVRKYIGIPNADPVFDTLLEIKRKTKIHIEITDLIVPGVGDNLSEARKLARWIGDNLGPETTLHFLRFHPDYKMMDIPPTPITTLENHWRVAKEEGLDYVYLGNVPGHRLEHTYCPSCGQILVKRHGFQVLNWYLDHNNRCPICGKQIEIIGSYEESIMKQGVD